MLFILLFSFFFNHFSLFWSQSLTKHLDKEWWERFLEGTQIYLGCISVLLKWDSSIWMWHIKTHVSICQGSSRAGTQNTACFLPFSKLYHPPPLQYHLQPNTHLLLHSFLYCLYFLLSPHHSVPLCPPWGSSSQDINGLSSSALQDVEQQFPGTSFSIWS